MKKTALLVIDVQEGIVHDPYFPMWKTEELLERINRLIDAHHYAHRPVILIRHTEGGGSPLQEGLPTWQLDQRLHVSADDVILNKTTPDSFYLTSLSTILKDQSITDLVVCGLQTDYCVDTTTRSAFSHGYPVILISDAHSTCDSGELNAKDVIDHHNRVLGNWFATLKTTDDYLASIQ
jgi:nicotinamidase-related amidase